MATGEDSQVLAGVAGEGISDDTTQYASPGVGSAAYLDSLPTTGNTPNTALTGAFGLYNANNGLIDALSSDMAGRLVTNAYDAWLLVLQELRLRTQILVEGLGIQTEPDAYRLDPSFDVSTFQ